MATNTTSSDPAFLAAYGEAVQARREELGLDRKQLAERTGISYSYLSAIESGQKLPSGTYQTMLSVGLELTPAELLARANGAVSDMPDREERLELRRESQAPRMVAARALTMESPQVARSEVRLDRLRTPTGVIAELEALLPRLAREDQDMVLGMVRRLAGSEPPPQKRNIQEQSNRGSRGKGLRTESYLKFWTMYLDALEEKGLDWSRGRRPEPRSYFTTSSPIRGSSLSASFARNKLLRHEMYINRGSRQANIELLNDLEAHRHVIENAYGARLDFEDPGRERRAVRIAKYRDGHISHPDKYDEYIEWFVDHGIRMRRAMDAYVREIQD
jgi:transcriptional regulator with XRE-family HTH domain